MEEKIVTYKGTNKDMKCRGYQYELGKEYETDKAQACKAGFHGCEYPLDVFGYYPPGTSRYFECEQSGKIDRDGDDSKIASTKIKMNAEIGISGLVKAAIEYTKSRTTTEHTAPKMATAGDSGAATAGYKGAATAGDSGAATAGDSGAATAGNYGAATTGNYGAATAGNYGAATTGYKGAATAGDSGAATAGDCGAATAGDCGAATAGYKGAATAGDCGAATAGDSGAATAGNYGAATAGNYGAATAGDSGAATTGYKGAATAGDCGAATSRGRSATGKNGLSVARGIDVMVKGGLGALLVIAEEKSDSYDIDTYKVAVVDGEKIKADTWYRLVGGELAEATDV